MTLIEQYKQIQAARQKASESLVSGAFGSIPTVIFTVGDHGNNFEPKVWAVTGISAPFIQGTYLEETKRPTRAIIAAFDGEVISEQNVCIHIKRVLPQWTESRAVKITECGSAWSISKDAMVAKGDEIRKFYTLKTGQFHCRQCGKVVDQSQKVTRHIIARQYPGGSKSFDHCSAACAAHNQMAHEG